MNDNDRNDDAPMTREVDAVIVGAGFAGLYLIHRLRDLQGLEVAVFDDADGVGGTWYWNRYPGARCDIESIHYSYSFSDEIEQQWDWTEKYPAQAEILDYLNFVARKLDLLRSIQFQTRVTRARYDERHQRWIVGTNRGNRVSTKYFIPAVGVLSTGNIPRFKNDEIFEGRKLFTGKWPQEPVSFKGKRVGIIGTGATGIQVIPVVAEEAAHLTVFQRSPNYAVPLRNEPLSIEARREIKAIYRELRRKAWASYAGVPYEGARASAVIDDPATCRKHLEACWEAGGFTLWLGSYRDVLIDPKANEIVAEFVREKIRQRVENPEVAERLCPKKGVAYGTKRQPCETNYYETFNRDNVALVDLVETPILEFTRTGVRTSAGDIELDCLIYATGFDAFTGSLFAMNIEGRGGQKLQAHWQAGPRTYLGIATHGFPNMFVITGPLSPTVLFNMPLSIEQHCEWTTDCIEALRRRGIGEIEATLDAEEKWMAHVRETAERTLLPKADSWYLGANIPGKPRVFMVYVGGGPRFKRLCSEIAENGYEGFELREDSGSKAARN